MERCARQVSLHAMVAAGNIISSKRWSLARQRVLPGETSTHPVSVAKDHSLSWSGLREVLYALRMGVLSHASTSTSATAAAARQASTTTFSRSSPRALVCLEYPSTGDAYSGSAGLRRDRTKDCMIDRLYGGLGNPKILLMHEDLGGDCS